MFTELPERLRDAVRAELMLRAKLENNLTQLRTQYQNELGPARPEQITLAVDKTQDVLHYVLRIDDEWVSSAYSITELEDQLIDRIHGNTDMLDCMSTVRLGGLEECLERTNNGFTPKTYRVVVADFD